MFRHRSTFRLGIFSFIYFFLSLSLNLVFFATDALLITQAGPSFLFYVYFGGSLFSLVLSFIFYFFKQDGSSSKKIDSYFLSLSIWLFGGWFLLTLPNINSHFYVIFNGFFYGIYLLANLRFWISASECFSSFEAQRKYPILLIAGLLGDIAAGAFASLFANYFQPSTFVLFCAVVLLIIPFLIAGVPKQDTVLPPDKLKTETTSFNFLKSRKTLLVLGFTLSLFWCFYSFSSYSVDYLFNVEILKHFATQDKIISYLGKLSFWASLGILGYQIFLLSPIGRRFASEKTIYLISFLLFGFFSWIYFSPSLMTLTLTQALLHYFVEYGTANFMQPVLNAIPPARKKAFKLFTEAIAQPIGTVILLLLALFYGLNIPLEVLTLILFLSSLILLVYPFWFQRVYRQYLIECLHSDDTLLVVNAIQALGGTHNVQAVPALLELLHHTKEIHLQKSLVLSLGQIQSREAFREILSLFSTRQESLQLAVVESLGNYQNYESMFALLRLLKSKESVSLQVRMNATQILTRLIGNKMIPFLMEALDENQDLRIRANAVESIGLLHDVKTIPILVAYLKNPNHRLKANALIALYPFRSTRRKALQALRELSASSEKNAQLAALYAAAYLKLKSYRKMMLGFLHSPDASFRLMACLGLARLQDKRFCDVYMQLLLGKEEKQALECVRRMADFPRTSRYLIFEHFLALDDLQKHLFKKRLDQSPLDFSNEWWMTRNKTRLWGLGKEAWIG